MSAPRFAVLPPYAAVFLVKRVPSREVRQYALWARQQGRPDMAAQLEMGWAQLQAAAADYHAAGMADSEASTSVDGSGSAEVVPRGGESGHEVTTAEVAKGLGMSTRRVGQLIKAGRLRARKVGRTWLVDASSVEDLDSLRRSA